MTLLEMTVAIVVLLSFVGMSVIGVRAWKRGSDRSQCVLNIYHAQKAVRSFANLYGFHVDQTLSRDLEGQVFGPDSFISARPECPSDGKYTTTGNRIPKVGELYMSCSLGERAKHRPVRQDTW